MPTESVFWFGSRMGCKPGPSNFYSGRGRDGEEDSYTQLSLPPTVFNSRVFFHFLWALSDENSIHTLSFISEDSVLEFLHVRARFTEQRRQVRGQPGSLAHMLSALGIGHYELR